jgi:hypothetical protein
MQFLFDVKDIELKEKKAKNDVVQGEEEGAPLSTFLSSSGLH